MNRLHLAAVVALSLGILAPTRAADFVHVARGAQGSWCFEQDGRRFYSMGICTVIPREAPRVEEGRFYDGAKVRGGVDAWAASAVERMTSWGFNTAGSWCDEALYAKAGLHTRYVWLGAEVDGIKQRLVNVFSPGYPAKMDALCAEFVAPHKDDPRLIGWFLDNELPWYGEHGWPEDPNRSLLDLTLALPGGDPNRVEAVRFLREAYGDFGKFTRQWDTSATTWEALTAGGTVRAKTKLVEELRQRWAGHVAERFFSVCAAAVRKHDPNHLVLGSRFAGNAPGPVFAACARHCDVVSVNHYEKEAATDLAWWDHMYAIVQKPILLTEFSWRATENRTGNRNTLGADVTVPTQRDRAERYGRYVSALMSRPYLVGMHWFQWNDEPERGRSFDGEDSNYGLVDWQDQAYEELVAAAQKTHSAIAAPDVRAGALPSPADRDGLAWSVRPLPTLPEGKLAAPFECAAAGVPPQISGDDKAGSRGTATREGAAWKIDYADIRGWGLNALWSPPKTQLAGAKTVRVSFDTAAGTKFQVVLSEREGDGGDGECWLSDVITSPGGKTDVQIDLREMERNAYAGNQKGNRRLDLDAILNAGLYFPNGQPQGALRISGLVLGE